MFRNRLQDFNALIQTRRLPWRLGPDLVGWTGTTIQVSRFDGRAGRGAPSTEQIDRRPAWYFAEVLAIACTMSVLQRRGRKSPILALLLVITISICRAAFADGAQIPESQTWFDGLPHGDPILTVPGTPPSRKVKLAGTTRNALLAHEGRPLSLDVSGIESIEISMAVVCVGTASTCTGHGVFTVQLESPRSGVTRQLHSATIKARSVNPTWETAAIHLGEIGREAHRVRLEYHSGEDGKPDDGVMAAVWGEPILRHPSEKDDINVILISVDTLRADRLSTYGHHRNTSPAMDHLASQGVRFSQVVAQAPWTTPSHVSMLTSLHPSSHKVNDSWEAIMQRETRGQRRLDSSTETIASLMRKNGYRTSAVTDGAPTISAEIGFDQGFDRYREVVGKPFSEYWNNVSDQLTTLAKGHFFLFLHTFEVHSPYTHLRFAKPLVSESEFAALEATLRPGLRELGDGQRLRVHLRQAGLMREAITSALYDGGIRFVDEFLIAALVDQLDRLGIADRTIVVVTSDHGEEFGEHERIRIYDAHCNNLWDPVLLVPLIIRAPGRIPPGKVVPDQVRVIDVAPTILDLVGLQIPPAMEGRSLIPLLSQQQKAVPVPAISEATCKGPEWKSIRMPDHKMIIASTVDQGAWWEVDLGQSVEIDQIRIWTRTDTCCDPLEYYWTVVADHPNPNPSDSGIFRHFEAATKTSPTTISVGRSGRYVRVLKFGDGEVVLAEVEVLHDGTNISVGRPATQSTTAFGASASRALDGSTNGHFQSGSVAHTLRENTPSVADRTGIAGDYGVEMLFNLEDDPAESRNVLPEMSALGDRLRTALEGEMRDLAAKHPGEQERREVSPAILERLRALGYAD